MKDACGFVQLLSRVRHKKRGRILLIFSPSSAIKIETEGKRNSSWPMTFFLFVHRAKKIPRTMVTTSFPCLFSAYVSHLHFGPLGKKRKARGRKYFSLFHFFSFYVLVFWLRLTREGGLGTETQCYEIAVVSSPTLGALWQP